MLKIVTRIGLLLGLLAGVAACAPVGQPTAMVVDVQSTTLISEDSLLHAAIDYEKLTDGREDPIPDESLKGASMEQALLLSLRQHTMLGDDDAPLKLTVQLIDEDLPIIGASMTVSHQYRYTLTRDGETVFDEVVPSTHTTPFSASLIGATRARLAIEGSSKSNIRIFLERLVAAAKADPSAFGDLKVSLVGLRLGA
ncbi:MAG: hypothetical protein AAF674_13840 [Pseudomonadota bacterium]